MMHLIAFFFLFLASFFSQLVAPGIYLPWTPAKAPQRREDGLCLFGVADPAPGNRTPGILSLLCFALLCVVLDLEGRNPNPLTSPPATMS